MSVTNTIGSPTTRSHKRLEMLRERPCHFLGVHSRVKVIRSYNDGIAEAPTFGNLGSGLPVAVASAVELGEAKESKLGRSFSIPLKPMRVL